MYIYSRIFKI